MNRKKTLITSLLAGLGIAILILDSKTAAQATAEALDLCIRVVIPSLFPLFVFSVLLTGSLDGRFLSFLKPVGRLCGMPENSEVLLLTGFLGGYPTGAQCVAQAHSAGALQKKDAVRMLPLCSNAGPAFIFGIAGTLFSDPAAPWLLWLIQILSALILGWVLAPDSVPKAGNMRGESVTVTQALHRSIRAMASVCGWILLFRCFIAFFDKWLFRMFPKVLQAVLIGSLELTNGCWFLLGIEGEGLRFVLCSAFLSFGGLCIMMQTLAVTGALGLRGYLSGKLLQMLIASSFSAIVLPLLFESSEQTIYISVFAAIATAVLIFFLKYGLKFKKTVAIHGIRVYNEQKSG